MSTIDEKLQTLIDRVDKLEHALLVMATWHHGQDEYVKSILGPEAIQCAEVEHGDCSDKPIFETKQWIDWIGKKLKEDKWATSKNKQIR